MKKLRFAAVLLAAVMAFSGAMLTACASKDDESGDSKSKKKKNSSDAEEIVDPDDPSAAESGKEGSGSDADATKDPSGSDADATKDPSGSDATSDASGADATSAQASDGTSDGSASGSDGSDATTPDTSETTPSREKEKYGYRATDDEIVVNGIYTYPADVDYQPFAMDFTSHVPGNNYIYFYAYAYDSAGKELGQTGMSVNAVGDGETALAVLYFYQLAPIDHITYEVFFEEAASPISARKDLAVNCGIGEKLIIEGRNRGDRSICVEGCTIIFFDKAGNVLYVSYAGLDDLDYELKAGDRHYDEVSLPDGYAYYKVFTDVTQLDNTHPAPTANPKEIEFIGDYTYGILRSGDFDDSKYHYLCIKNLADTTKLVTAHGCLRDAKTGELVGTIRSSVVVGPGDVDFLFYVENEMEKHPELSATYTLDVRDTDAIALNSQISGSVSFDGSTFVVTATNNSSYEVKNLRTFVVVFDAEGNYYTILVGFFGEPSIQPGETQSREFDGDFPKADHWELYYQATAYNN
ncbi:MAG: hypothetical protein IK125_00990 [Lachnospiraceae bacterium]|nr:hypothetical protein [Lachnospiraceae bacterium]